VPDRSQAIRTTATRASGDYIVSGSKEVITNARTRTVSH
jgi:alkylation response protein AidB-like acyl-CoA dehydrogenase